MKYFFRCSFNKRRQRLADVLGFTEIHVTEHKHIMSLSILNNSNQSPLKQSDDSLKIFPTPKRSEFTGAQKLFPSCLFLFVKYRVVAKRRLPAKLSG